MFDPAEPMPDDRGRQLLEGMMAAPGAPTEVVASADGSTVTVTWKAPTGAAPTEYKVLRGLSADSLRTQGTVAVPKLEFLDVGLGAATYHYAVQAKNADGESPNSGCYPDRGRRRPASP